MGHEAQERIEIDECDRLFAERFNLNLDSRAEDPGQEKILDKHAVLVELDDGKHVFACPGCNTVVGELRGNHAIRGWTRISNHGVWSDHFVKKPWEFCPGCGLGELVYQIPKAVEFDPVNPDEIAGFLNAFGEVRRANIEREFDLNDKNDVAKVIELYKKWVTLDEYITIRRTEEIPGKTSRKWFTVKASKRGNDVYAYHVKRDLKGLEASLKRFAGSDGTYTSLLYVTLTCNPEIYENDRNRAWKDLGKDFNRFLSRLKKVYGPVLVLRSWEAFKNGFPHCHALIAFKSWHFVYFKHKKYVENQDGDRKEITSFRIATEDKKRISGLWHSFIDVIAVTQDNLQNTLRDVAWYVTKNSCGIDYREIEKWHVKKTLTLATLWYLNLRSFSVSRELMKHDPGDDLNTDIKAIQTTTTQMDLNGNLATVVYDFIGMVSGQKSGLKAE